jgi:hypothetical protein
LVVDVGERLGGEDRVHDQEREVGSGARGDLTRSLKKNRWSASFRLSPLMHRIA